MRNPIILPKCNRLVEVLLEQLNEKRGYKSLVYESRKQFWILGVRHMAKPLTGEYLTCKKCERSH